MPLAQFSQAAPDWEVNLYLWVMVAAPIVAGVFLAVVFVWLEDRWRKRRSESDRESDPARFPRGCGAGGVSPPQIRAATCGGETPPAGLNGSMLPRNPL